MLEMLRSLEWANLSKAPSPGVIATGLAVVGILGSIFGLNIHFDWLPKKDDSCSKVTPTSADKKQPRRSRRLFPESDGHVIPADSDALSAGGPTPCATDSYVGFRPSSFDENSGVYVEWNYNSGEVPALDKYHTGDLDYNGWVPSQPVSFSQDNRLEFYNQDFAQSPHSVPVSMPIPVRRGPMRSSFSDPHGHSASFSSYNRTPYASRGEFHKPAAIGVASTNSHYSQLSESLASSPEMSPNFYSADLSPVFDGTANSTAMDPPANYHRDRMASFDLPAQPTTYGPEVVGLCMVEQFPETTGYTHSRHSSEEWYSDNVAEYGNIGFDPSVLTVQDAVDSTQFTGPFLPTPELDSAEYDYTVSTLTHETKVTIEIPISEDSDSPSVEHPQQLPSPSSLSSRSGGEDSFQCPECDAAFRVKGYLTRHLKKHAENKAYTCPFYNSKSDRPCHPNGGFSRRDTYKAHLKSRHFAYPRKTPCAQRSQVAGNCRECGEKFESNELWAEKHIRLNLCPGLKTRAADTS